MRIRHWAIALGAILLTLIALPSDATLLHAAVTDHVGPALLLFGAVGGLTEIRLLDDLGYGTRAFSKNDIVKVGRGENAVDAETAELWVRQGHALAGDPADMEGPDLGARATHVVVHERGGQELLQGMTTVTKAGSHEGPAPENPTDSDPEADAEAGRARTDAGAVIAENADPEPVAAAKPSGKKSGKRG